MSTWVNASFQYMQAASEPLGNVLHLPKLAAFSPVITLSFATCAFIHFILTPVLCAALLPHSYKTANKQRRSQWGVKVVSQIHVLTILPLIMPLLQDGSLDQDRVFGWNDRYGLPMAISCGYFLWDLVTSVWLFTDLGFVIHALSCLAIYLMAFQPFLVYYGPRFLTWEISTLFLNIHWALDKTGRTGSTLQFLNGYLLLASFAGARLLYGAKMSFDFYVSIYNAWGKLPTTYILVYGVGNVVLNSLNWMWFFKMIATLRKRQGFGKNGPQATAKKVD